MVKHRFVLIGERPLYFYQTYYGVLGWLKNKFPSDLLWFSRGHSVKFYYEENDVGAQKKLWQHVVKNPKFMSSIVQNFRYKGEKLKSFFDVLDPNNASDKKLFQAYKEVIKFYQYYQGEGNAYARLIDRYGMEVLRKELQKQKVKDVETVISMLTAPSEESYLAFEERMFWEGVVHAKRKKDLDIFLARHLEQYGWVGRSYMEEPALTMRSLRKRLSKTPQNERGKKLTHLLDVLKQNDVQRNTLIKEYQLDKAAQHYSAILRESAALKDVIRGVLAEVYYYSDKVFDELENRTGLRRSIIKNLTIEEFETIFLKAGKLDSALIKKREQGPFGVFPIGKKIEVVYGEEASDFEQNHLTDNSLRELKEFKGRPVSPGRVSGTVRVVYTWKEMKLFKKGEILVVNNTNPAFAPYLHKAAAIVAAEGGVTVHVAIISREMKIPCVIGISDVTRLLKTGERVEVDVGRGVVRRL